MRRFVLDPNVVIAALGGSGPTGPPALLLGALRAREIEVVACATLIEAVRRGLRKPYFRARLSEDEAQWELRAVERVALMVDDPTQIPAVLRDPADDYLLVLAQDAEAEAIVTGDLDLLEHGELTPPAISPRDACARLGLAPAADAP